MATDSEYKRWYDLSIWRKSLRPAQLRRQPLCEYCLKRELTVVAQVVDHITPHQGDWSLFRDPDNLQSLCKSCHDGAKQAQERGSLLRGCGTDGLPLDPNHTWNKE
jgi:5-methylcytosine-specific restriction endonuclease McrA